MNMMVIERFVSESNAIEQINRPPTDDEVVAHSLLFSLKELTIQTLENFVEMIDPEKKLRRTTGQDVRIGIHYPEPGGPNVVTQLEAILADANQGFGAWLIHNRYQHLHPFTDVNGRSGRALWAWQMLKKGRDIDRGFLLEYYYQTLFEYDGAQDRLRFKADRSNFV